MSTNNTLTEKQNAVYQEVINKAVKGMISAEYRKTMVVDLGMNVVSFGLVIKALADKKLIDVNKDKSISIPLTSEVVGNSEQKISAPLKKEVMSNVAGTVVDEIFNFIPEDRDINLFYDLKECGAIFDTKKYSFSSTDSKIIKEMKNIIEFHTAPNSACTPAQRQLRDAIIEKFNLDMEAKKINGKVYMINTNGLADLKDIVNFLKKKKVASTIKGNKVIFS